MVFSNVIFLFRFLPLFMICYYVAPQRLKNVILLLGSLFFYGWGEPVYIVLMLFSIISDYCHGRLIEQNRHKNIAKLYLISSLVINLGLLGFFKYADFLVETINQLANTQFPLMELPLPIGISFYTFQTMSYSIDVYRGEVKAQKSLLDFAVFVTMFPQLIAGPIVKYRDVEKKLSKRRVNLQMYSYGIKRFVLGLAKKVLLANNLGVLWAEIGEIGIENLSSFTALLGIIAYAFQIYFDFSGYSDMAIGLGYCLGFRFPENFNYPYISRSITEFWRRWHISLSSWFREYVYIPLGGNRKGRKRQLLNILIVWSLTGIWHGAGFSFLIWGLWFALFLILEKLFLGRLLAKLPGQVAWLYTSFVVLIGWVFFSVESPAGILGYLKALTGCNAAGWFGGYGFYYLKEYGVLFLLAALGSTPVIARFAKKLYQGETGLSIAAYHLAEKLIPVTLLLLSVAYIVESSFNPFLYFRF